MLPESAWAKRWKCARDFLHSRSMLVTRKKKKELMTKTPGYKFQTA